MKPCGDIYQELIDTYGKLVWGVCGSILKNAGTAEDIEECVADVFIHVWKKPNQYKAEKGSMQTYLAVLARSTALNTRRKKKYFLPLDETFSTDPDSVILQVLRSETNALVTEAVEQLKEPDREIFFRRHFLDQKPRDIARALGLDNREARNRLYQSR